ncbi:hypothetical protein [Sphingobacterium multivorum]|uniref:Apea-like HEPN domain-containing protein n=1 Tax=Sphingobacterium multivorum TaxID=28454 RepID=A0A2X2KMA6_SPHMU|nr:hypothetical protein [Sphingobacterium multivorum]QRQ59797.1 hypothetical protein I6J33_16675 [Sphingobacterium multivorum]SPZ83569.1 Uncharacterised protein [Sphingobacterium multivorum]
MAINEFDEIDWLIGFLKNADGLKKEGISRIRNFLLLWNLLEDVTLGKDANIAKIRHLVDQIHQNVPLVAGEFDEFVDYFSKRYFDPTGQSPYSLDGLKFRSGANDQGAKAEVKAVLTKSEQNPVMVLKALLIICYRFRNNLFHGEKQLVILDGQINNFIVANNILKLILEKMKAAGILNL